MTVTDRTMSHDQYLPYFPDSWTPGMYMIQGGGSRTTAILEIFFNSFGTATSTFDHMVGHFTFLVTHFAT